MSDEAGFSVWVQDETPETTFEVVRPGWQDSHDGDGPGWEQGGFGSSDEAWAVAKAGDRVIRRTVFRSESVHYQEVE